MINSKFYKKYLTKCKDTFFFESASILTIWVKIDADSKKNCIFASF